MFVNKNLGVQSIEPVQPSTNPITSNQTLPPVGNVYKADGLTLNTLVSSPVVPPTIDPNNPPQVPVAKTSFFNRPEVRLAGMAIGGGAVFGTIGYFAGSAMGSAGMGAGIGVGLGIIAPLAMLGYALYKWGKG